MKTQKVKLAELVLDFSVYPRTSVDMTHAGYLQDTLEAGNTLPPMIVEESTLRIVDGFHRYHAYKKFLQPDDHVEVHFKEYPSEQDLFVDAVRLNATHGKSLNRFDRQHCLLLAEKLKVAHAAMALALKQSPDQIQGLRERWAKKPSASPLGETTEFTPLKRTIRHMAGRALTEAQLAANTKLSGMEPVFYINQVILLIKNDLLDKSNSNAMQALRHLKALLDDLLKAEAA